MERISMIQPHSYSKSSPAPRAARRFNLCHVAPAGARAFLFGAASLIIGCSGVATGPDGTGGTGVAGDGDGDLGGGVGGTGVSGVGGAGVIDNGSGGAAVVGGGGGSGIGSGGETVVVPPGEVPGGILLKGHPEYYRVVRLTNVQWENSIRDIFGLSALPGKSNSFFPDPPEGTFTNNERALFIADELWSDYQRASEELAESLSSNASVLAIFGGTADSAAFISAVGHRAFRRALSAAEVAAYQGIWADGATYYASGNAAADGARVFLEAILQSPYFLFRLETTPTGQRLTGAELATKLSLLLRNTTPSDALLASAESGDLDTDAGLAAAAQAMLAEGEAREVVAEFHTELYGLDRYKNIAKNPTLFPAYNDGLNEILMNADLMFFNRVFDQDAGLREILTSNVAYVNDATAVFYGIASPGAALTEVLLDDDRPGFLTRVGYLAYNATLVDPDPIHRGVDINNRMLCMDLSPPAGEIPPLPAPQPNQTNRERVEAHTGSGLCATCHGEIINPLGYAFENFDAMGQFRTEDNGQPIDTAAAYGFNDGLQAFDDAPGLISLMAENQQTHGCYSRNLAEFVLARDVAGTEEALVAGAQGASFTNDASIKELILTMIQDPLFTTAQGGAQ